MYKDKDRQKEANRRHAKAYRQRKGMTEGMMGMTHGITGMTVRHTVAGITKSIIRNNAVKLIEERIVSQKPTVAHSPNCRCLLCGGSA